MTLIRLLRSSFLVAACLPAIAARAQTPVSYSMLNGQGQVAGGAFNYWDEPYTGSGSPTTDGSPLSGGLGQLTDGVLGGQDWASDLGQGNAYEWVAWKTFDPTITLDYGATVHLNSIGLFTNNNQIGGVALWASVDFAFSNDGTNWFGNVTHTATQADLDDTTARFLETNVGGVDARYARLDIHRLGDNWAFVSEISTNAVPAPTAASVLAIVGLSLVVRRRR